MNTQPASVWTECQGVKLHALDFPGCDPAVIIVPGITSPAATWKFVARGLDIDNRILILDVRGRGHSGKPDTGYSMQHYSDDLEQWRQALELKNPILLGHSMGARIVAEFDARWPGLVAGLIAVDPPLSGPGRAAYPFPLEFYIEQMRETEQSGTLDTMRTAFPTWTDEQLDDRLQWLPTCAEAAVRESYENFHTEDFFPTWRGVTAPRLCLCGATSPVVTTAGLDEMKLANPGAEYIVVEAAGHMIPWDNLNGFLKAALTFIASQSEPQPTPPQ